MHWTTHVLSGASIGYIIGRPLPAAIAGFVGHMALDAVPHADPESEAAYVLDSLAGAALIALLAASKGVRHADPAGSALAGAIGAGAPDVELLRKLFTTVSEEDYLYPSHRGTVPHRQTDTRTSLVVQGGLLLAALTAAFWKWSRLRGAQGGAERAG